MRIRLHPKHVLTESAEALRQPVVCRYVEAEDTLIVYATPHFYFTAAAALNVDSAGRNDALGDEAAHVLMGLLRLGRSPRLLVDSDPWR